ncbi:MAG: ABC transporter substrate-binding protein [Betaproteobacteria bacterium]|nr:ABC transporter substrate-binding protein [Betaproteobacteria bacterium]NBT74888.1 ABC transporter substrate-binding protein [Betaproteobacteria bacterium]NCA15486.1 ABC transporter substrate-binding protein [Betaproteobacteria bacterium]
MHAFNCSKDFSRCSLAIKAALAVSGALVALSVQAQKINPCIGASGPLTGAAAFGGESIRMGAEIAIDEINAKGGVLGQKLTFKIYDDGGQPPKGVDNVRRVALADNCIAMLGGYHSGVQLAMRDPVGQAGIPYVGTTAAGTGIIEHENGQNKWMFRVSAKDKWVAQFLVEQALSRSKNKKVALLYENTGWGNGGVPDVEAAMKAKGLALAAKETFNWNDVDMTPQLLRVRDAGVDTVIFWALDREGNQLLRGMDKIGWRPGNMVAAWGLAGNLGEIAGKLSNGVLVFQTYTWMGKLEPRADAIWKKIQAKYGLKNPEEIRMGSAVANSYDAVYIIAQAIEKAGSFDRAKVRDAMYQVRHDGLVAKYEPAFEKNQERHDAILPRYYKLTAWHDGKLLPLSETPYK